jgi:threonine dehydratase
MPKPLNSHRQNDINQPIETPIIRMWHGGDVFLKDETKQISGAFKYRGVFHKLMSSPPGTNIVTASTGNHGIAVAEIAARLGFRAHIFLPISAPAYKLQVIQKLNAGITVTGSHLDDCSDSAKLWARFNEALWISGFDDPTVIQGYSSMFSEISKQLDQFECIFVPIGGGGLLAAALSYFPHSTQVVAVASSAVNSMMRSLESGRPIRVNPSPTIATGLAVPQVGQIAYDICATVRPEIVGVDDFEIRSAMRLLWEIHGIRAEAAGAAALAGALKAKNRLSARSVCIVSGGNIDPNEHAFLSN